MSASYTTTHASPESSWSPFEGVWFVLPEPSWSWSRSWSWSSSSKGACVAAAIALLYLFYNVVSPSLLSGSLWDALAFVTPARLVFAVDRRRNPEMYQGDAPPVKSDALRRVFGLGSASALNLPGATSSWLPSIAAPSHAPPGLGNWDNSCYQNSVLQGLSALKSLTTYLDHAGVQQDPSTTAASLRETMTKLNDSSNNGRRLWTPSKLKSMSSWQQQDAQEYFSKIMDDLEKETVKASKAAPTTSGLAEFDSLDTVRATSVDTAQRAQRHNPLDGFLAQRVACTSCGFSEGLSMIPFNCLTVPLGKDYEYQIENCLDEYAALEEISGVECGKCTLLRTKTQLQQMTQDSASDSNTSVPSPVGLPADLRSLATKRLQAVQQALDENDLSDDTLNKKCQISKKARVSSTKTRQAVIARAPASLVIHINRSVFDEYTGAQRKNLAQVIYPKILDLAPWCLGAVQEGNEQEQWRMDPLKSMIGPSINGENASGLQYVLRAAVTHYGRHENGHYICYREHPELPQKAEEGEEDDEDDTMSEPKPARWWRLSDDDVSAVTEEQVLSQGGVFMLFYERFDQPTLPPISPQADRAENEAVVPTTIEIVSTTDTEVETIESDHSKDTLSPDLKRSPAPETTFYPTPEATPDRETAQPGSDIKKRSTPQMMRTAGKNSKRGKGGLSSTYRAMAAT